MYKKRGFLIMISLIAVLIISSAIYAKNIVQKKEFNAVDEEDVILVEGNGVMVFLDEFVSYRENVEMINSLPDQNQKIPIFSDEEVIKILLRNKVAANEAKKLGFQADQDQIDEIIKFDIEVLKMTDDPENDHMRELMMNRLSITDMTVEEFYHSDKIRESYENADLLTQWINHLISEEEIADYSAFELYMNNFLDKKMKEMTIHWSLMPE